MRVTLHFCTNRAPQGENDRITGFGIHRSLGNFDLRFGDVQFTLTDDECAMDGMDMADAIRDRIESEALLTVYDEQFAGSMPTKLGSQHAFAELKSRMEQGADALIYIHGYNVDWWDAVSSAIALQQSLRNARQGDADDVVVVLFSWPSDGEVLLYTPYLSDRDDARSSGLAFTRALLKLRDHLQTLRRDTLGATYTTRREYLTAAADSADPSALGLCRQDIHLLAHSMGNYVLQSAVEESMRTPDRAINDRLFDHVFLCAADVDVDVLEQDRPLAPLCDLARNITVYHHDNDRGLQISMTTKHWERRLGLNGLRDPRRVPVNVHQVDCTSIDKGLSHHGYYLSRAVLRDIKASMDAVRNGGRKWREGDSRYDNTWRLV
jgi:esterase/lipase superfamily enzyme